VIGAKSHCDVNITSVNQQNQHEKGSKK